MLEIVIILLLILANGLFAMSEIAVVSARKPRLKQLADEGSASARRALELAEHPNRFLATVQIGISLVGVVAGAFGGATLAEPLANWLTGAPWLAPYSDTLAFAVVVLTITYLSLVVGELVPKRMALNNPEALAMRVAGFMNRLSILATPLVKLLSLSTEGVLRLLRVRASGEPTVSEEEIAVMIEQGRQAGVFKNAEQEVIENVFWLDERSVASVMTPRREVVWLDLEASPEAWLEQISRSPYSRLLVARGQLDELAGVVYARELLLALMAGEASPARLEALVKPPAVVPETMSALRVLEHFKANPVHLAVVVDEYGGIEGLVTMDDLSDALLGELAAGDEEAFVQREDGSWLIDGRSSAGEVQERLGLLELPGDPGDYQTLAGMVITLLGHIPKPADTFNWEGYRFEIVDMDGARIDKVLVSREDDASPARPSAG